MDVDGLVFSGLTVYPISCGFQLSVSPNPSSDEVSVTANGDSSYNYELIDNTGNVLERGTIEKDSNNIQIKSLEDGLYYLRIIMTDKVIVRRIIKSN